MRTKTIIKIGTSFLVLILAILGFYRFMTYDRNYAWTKELEGEVANVFKPYGFNVVRIDRISTDNIILPTERSIKIKIQKCLNKVNLMNYGEEIGKSILLKSDNTKGIFNCKAWCLSDHVIGLEIQYSNVEENILSEIKQDVETQFNNCKIAWTKITD